LAAPVRPAALLALLLVASPLAWAETLQLSEPVVMRGAAVAETPGGLVGSTASFTITVASNGSGHVFLDTFPLTQIDMQGSARLAARVASQVTGKPLHSYDFFFVIRSGSTQIGGPSAGATLAVGAIAALHGWNVAPDVLMTGTIQPDGSVGPVGGIPEKAQAAAQAGMRRFLFPAGEETTTLSATGAQVDLPDYCRRELSIDCLPVSDVYEAVENMTDHAIVRPPVTGDVTGESFRATLGPLGEDLLEGARSLLQEAQAEVAQAPAGDARVALDQEVADAEATLRRAESAYANGTYYTAASLSFQSSIASHDARDRARLVRASDPQAALRDLLADAQRKIADVRAEVERAVVTDAGRFESVGAAQVRLLEAEQRVARAQALLADGANLGDVVYEAAYSWERAETAAWWLRLGQDAATGTRVEAGALEEAATDAITTATEQIAYVEAVLQQANAGATLAVARGKLDTAEEALARGFHPAAILEAYEAQVRAGNVLAIASFGRVPPERLEDARVEAARAIQAARARGVEPILAQSEYEFAQSLTADPIEALSFFGMARVTANVAGAPSLFGSASQEATTRFQGIPPRVGASPELVAGALVVGVALGAGFGLLAAGGRKKRTPAIPASIEIVRGPAGHASVVEQERWRD
jgi:uncharacterized protein